MKDVVVTGIGVLSSNGTNIESFWEALVSGKVGYGSTYLPPDYPFKTAGIICDPDFSRYLTPREIKQYDRATLLGMAAATQALQDARFPDFVHNSDEIAVIMGTTCGTNLTTESSDFEKKWFGKKISDIPAETFQRYNHLSIANAISEKYGFTGPSYIIGTACSSGNNAIGEAFDLIRSGKATKVICGGVDSLSLLPIYGFHPTLSLSEDKCAPFDKNRRGLIISEGAGVLIIESEESALKRDAKVYARIEGWALNCDAEKLAAPIASGERCMQLIESCLERCGRHPGTSTI